MYMYTYLGRDATESNRVISPWMLLLKIELKNGLSFDVNQTNKKHYIV